MRRSSRERSFGRAAWLVGDHATVAPATQAALELALQRRSPWRVGELGLLAPSRRD